VRQDHHHHHHHAQLLCLLHRNSGFDSRRLIKRVFTSSWLCFVLSRPKGSRDRFTGGPRYMITASHPLLAELSLDSLSLCVCVDVCGGLFFFVYCTRGQWMRGLWVPGQWMSGRWMHTHNMHRVRRHFCCPHCLTGTAGTGNATPSCMYVDDRYTCGSLCPHDPLGACFLASDSWLMAFWLLLFQAVLRLLPCSHDMSHAKGANPKCHARKRPRELAIVQCTVTAVAMTDISSTLPHARPTTLIHTAQALPA
jgi:hypothetical protein